MRTEEQKQANEVTDLDFEHDLSELVRTVATSAANGAMAPLLKENRRTLDKLRGGVEKRLDELDQRAALLRHLLHTLKKDGTGQHDALQDAITGVGSNLGASLNQAATSQAAMEQLFQLEMEKVREEFASTMADARRATFRGLLAVGLLALFAVVALAFLIYRGA